MALTALQAEVTKTSVFNGTGIDISALSGPFSVEVTVNDLTAGSTAIFELVTSTDSFSSDVRVEKTLRVVGPLTKDSPVTQTTHDYDMPGVRNGVTSAEMRLALSYIDGASTVTYSGYISN